MWPTETARQKRIAAFEVKATKIIKEFPNRTTKFYAEKLDVNANSCAKKLSCLREKGIICSEAIRIKREKNPLTYWWVKGFKKGLPLKERRKRCFLQEAAALANLVSNHPRQGSAFYADQLKSNILHVARTLSAMRRKGFVDAIILKDRARTAIWYIHDGAIPVPEFKRQEQPQEKSHQSGPAITEEDLQWQRFYQLPRQERIRIRMGANN